MGKCIDNPLPQEELERLYVKERLSAIKIGQIAGVKPAQIYYLLTKYGIQRRSFSDMGRVYQINEEYFDKIDTQEKAYWLGFLYADGYVTCQNEVGLSIKDTDIEHLKKYSEALSSNYPIHCYTVSNKQPYGGCRYARVLFRSSHMVESLTRNGCIPRKSLVLKWPTEEQVPLKYWNSFLLGYIDGDGCITFSDKAHRLMRIKICGTKEFLMGAVDQINTIVYPDKIFPPLEKRRLDKENTYSISISGKSRVEKILHNLYQSSPVHLDRKWEIFQNQIAC